MLKLKTILTMTKTLIFRTQDSRESQRLTTARWPTTVPYQYNLSLNYSLKHLQSTTLANTILLLYHNTVFDYSIRV